MDVLAFLTALLLAFAAWHGIHIVIGPGLAGSAPAVIDRGNDKGR